MAASPYTNWFIIGRFDQVIPIERSLKIVHLPDVSDIHILERSAHMGMFEELKESQEIIKSWLKWVFNPIYVSNY